MTPAGIRPTSLMSRMNGKKTQHTHTVPLIPLWEDQCEWHRMTRMTGPDCAVMCNLINTHTHTHTRICSFFYFLFFVSHLLWSISLNVLGTNLIYCNVAILLVPVLTKDLSISPRYRDASSVLLQLVNYWLNFTARTKQDIEPDPKGYLQRP